MQSAKALTRLFLTRAFGEAPAAAGPFAMQMQVRCYMRGFRNDVRKVKSSIKKSKVPKIDPSLFDPDFKTPISGSVPYGDMEEVREKDKEFASEVTSLTCRGFLRFQKPYEPPSDALNRVYHLVRNLSPNFSKMSDKQLNKIRLNDARLKFDVLSKAKDEFDYAVPNSMLPAMESIRHVADFYTTPIRTTTPFDELTRIPDLPPNLYVQKEPFRFTQETLHLHKGITAFPKSSTIVTGLRAKQKYQGFKAKQRWP